MIRLATLYDLDQIWTLRVQTTELLKSRNIDQWQHQNPSRETFMKDIELGEFFVYEKDQTIIGMIAIKSGIERTYLTIYDGAWGYDLPYLTIHRLAVEKNYLGTSIAHELLEYAEAIASEKKINYIRIDTYFTNMNAIKLFKKHGYLLRGWILLEPGEGDLRRLAFDKRWEG